MNPFRILSRNIKDAFKSVFRNFSLSIASISCITITLILVAVSIILSYNVNSFTKDIEKDVTVVVFLDKEVSKEQAKQIETDLNSLDNIESVIYISKEQVKLDMMKGSEKLSNILNQYTEETNPLLDNFNLKVKDITLIKETADSIKKMEGINSVSYGEGMVEELVSIFSIVKKVTLIVVVALILVTAFLISNTIKITISNRKKQIEIMRLVGASNSYIKRPFFIEGLVIGFLGSLIPIFTCCYGYIFFYEKFEGNLFSPLIHLVNPDLLIYKLIAVILAIALVVGAFGSYRAVKKYLKV